MSERSIDIYISYFYNIRFFPSTLVPVSTAMWDPKWFHDGKGQNHIYINDKGVLCGVRLPMFSPKGIDAACQKNCPLNPESCDFIKDYYNLINSRDAQEYMDALSEVAIESRKLLKLNDWPDICLIVHEPPTVKCSERSGIIKLFHDKLKLNIKEWNKK